MLGRTVTPIYMTNLRLCMTIERLYKLFDSIVMMNKLCTLIGSLLGGK